MTCDNWPSIMWDTYNARGSSAFVLFPLIIILGNFVALNLFLAILLANFANDPDAKEQAKRHSVAGLAHGPSRLHAQSARGLRPLPGLA